MRTTLWNIYELITTKKNFLIYLFIYFFFFFFFYLFFDFVDSISNSELV